MAHYAVMRMAKLKTMGDVAALGLHNERERGTPNADPALTAHNIRLAGSGDWVADAQSRLADVDRIRVNAVLAIEHVLTASRAWFTEASTAQQNMWMERSMQWLRDTYGTPNVVAAVLHIDEITPHIQALVVPIDERGLCWPFGVSVLPTLLKEALFLCETWSPRHRHHLSPQHPHVPAPRRDSRTDTPNGQDNSPGKPSKRMGTSATAWSCARACRRRRTISPNWLRLP